MTLRNPTILKTLTPKNKSNPCINCITLPICKATLLNGVPNLNLVDIVYDKCSLIRQYTKHLTNHERYMLIIKILIKETK